MANEASKIITSKDSNRSYLFDNIKAIMIFVVVSTHYLRATEGFAVTTLNGGTYLTMISFDMVLFLFVSGYFSKNVDKCRNNAFKTYLFPFLVLTLFMYGMRYLIYGHATLQFLYPTLALWFLLVMFFYRFFLKDLIKVRHILTISFAISILAGLVPLLDSRFALGRTFGFLPFFILGYYFNAEKVAKIRKLPKWSTILLLTVLLTYSGLMAYTQALPLSTWFFKSSYASLGISNITGILVRSGLIVVALGWIVVFLNLVPDKKTWYSDIGVNTMSVYALHLTFRHVIRAAGTDFGGGILSFIIPMLLVAVTVWILSRAAISDKYNFGMDKLYNFVMIPYRKIVEKVGRT